MSKYISLISLFVLFTMSTACKEEVIEASDPIVGTWKLTETLADPGDGSGVFQAVSSDVTIIFNTDASCYTNGSFCMIQTAAGDGMSGTYNSTDLIIQSSECSANSLSVRYELENNELIIHYPCFEQCSAKYIKQ